MQNLHAKTVEVEIIAEAEGVTYEHAVKKALATAVSKVTGMSVESSSSVVTSSIKIANNSQNLSSKGMTTNDATSVKTRGYINSYEIISKKQTNTNNYKVKVKALSKFIGGGNKVKVSMRFRGREMEHQNLGFDLLKKLTSEVEEYAKVEVAPKFEGRQIMMILVPQIAK